MYYAILWDRAGLFEKGQMDAKNDLDRSIRGDELTQMAEMARMREEMGLQSAPMQGDHVANQLEIAKKLREEMGLSPKGPPGSA